MKVLISGGGIAGPTLAYWLQKSGHEVLLVEQSPHLRSGGYVIDYPIAAFTRYQARMMPFLQRKQESAAKFAPKCASGITFRNLVTRLFRIPSFADFFVGRNLRDDIELPDYGF